MTSPDKPQRPFLRRVAIAAVLLLIVAGLALLWIHSRLRASLPRLAGEVTVSGLTGPVDVDRDALGIPTLRGQTRNDVAFGLGFLHAQDRFFQMDLQRRQAAGELSELLGSSALAEDRQLRIHRFRTRAGDILATSPPAVQRLIQAYTAGVNAGLNNLDDSPFEYLVLRTSPAPWQEEDTFLTLFAMFHLLQGPDLKVEQSRGLMMATLPLPLFDFLTPSGSSWDAPLLGGLLPPIPIPGPEAFEHERLPRAASVPPSHPADALGDVPVAAGSNLWAVDGRHTADGGALLANDMHLPMTMPNLWYRAVFSWPADPTNPTTEPHTISGATLPGAPLMVVGSSGKLAWGFTHAGVDTGDVVILDTDPATASTYSTPEGPKAFERSTEVLRVKGGPDESMEVVSTVWGPVLPAAHLGQRQVSRWVAHESAAVNFDLLEIETAASLEQALEIANRSGLPAQNIIVADHTGRIGWSLAGRVPHRFGFSGRVPQSWADGTRGWQGLLAPESVPRLLDPESGRLWAANNRLVDGEALTLLGSDGYALGARARQIRDQLQHLEQATVDDMLQIQLDDRALLLEPWQQLWLQALTPEAIAADGRRQEFRQLIADWDGHAAVDSVAYRLVRDARRWLAYLVFEQLTAPCKAQDPRFFYSNTFFFLLEQPLWQLVTERPAHLLNPEYGTWDDQLLAAIDALLDYHQGRDEPLADLNWGRFNTVSLRHPFSLALPALGLWLDTAPLQLPGDTYMPRLQTPRNGASQRMVVSPGREAEGIFHMPGGQSGHPLSPHYSDGHAAWAEGRPTPYLPGPSTYHLQLRPSG